MDLEHWKKEKQKGGTCHVFRCQNCIEIDKKISIWVLFSYEFDEHFQREDLIISFVESLNEKSFENGFCITNKDKTDKNSGIHVKANVGSISITEISREDPWPDFGVEMFHSWKNLWKNYESSE